MPGPSLATLNDELTQLTEEREALRQRHAGEVMPADARDRDHWIVNRVSEIRTLVEAAKQRQRDEMMADTSDWMSRPAGQIQHNVNADDAGRMTIMKAGWDIRSGMVYRRTSNGKEIAYLPEDVLFGPIPRESDDAVAAQHYREMRATFQPEYSAAFKKYVRARGRRENLTNAEQAALSEGVSEAGGYLVPPDIAAEILARRADASVMRRLATVRQTSRDRFQQPAVTPDTTYGSVYSSGFVGRLTGETPTSNTDVGPTFQQFEIGIKDFEAYTKVSNNLIADASSDVMAFLATDGGRNLGLVEDYYFINGTNTGLEPMGILNAGITTADVEGSTSNNISNTVSNAGSAPKIMALAYLVPGQYADGASWLFARATEGEILALVGADGRPWWQPAFSAGGADGAPPRLVNLPVFNSPWVPVDNTDTNKVMIVGDFKNYIIAERQGISVTVDDINLVGTKQTQIFIRSRAGGGVWNTDAFRIGVV